MKRIPLALTTSLVLGFVATEAGQHLYTLAPVERTAVTAPTTTEFPAKVGDTIETVVEEVQPEVPFDLAIAHPEFYRELHEPTLPGGYSVAQYAERAASVDVELFSETHFTAKEMGVFPINGYDFEVRFDGSVDECVEAQHSVWQQIIISPGPREDIDYYLDHLVSFSYHPDLMVAEGARFALADVLKNSKENLLPRQVEFIETYLTDILLLADEIPTLNPSFLLEPSIQQLYRDSQ